MYHKILCPVDGSATSNRGMHEAISFAKDQNAKLRFLHVIDTYFPVLDVAGDLNVLYLADIQSKNGKKILKNAEDLARKEGVSVDSKIVETVSERVCQSIVTQAKEWPADLVVMGTHGLRGLERLIMGSDAELVVRLSPAPVLLVNASKLPGQEQ